MNRIKKAAILLRLVERLREKGSWCGETHVQKATFFLQELMQVPTGFDFILYKHGPFSFDLRDELTALRADDLISLEPQWPYGPRIIPTDLGEHIQKRYPKTLEKYDGRITFVADKFGDKGVAELERLASAFYVTVRGDGDRTVERRTDELAQLKPHISAENAKSAIEKVDKILEEGQPLIQ